MFFSKKLIDFDNFYQFPFYHDCIFGICKYKIGDQVFS